MGTKKKAEDCLEYCHSGMVILAAHVVAMALLEKVILAITFSFGAWSQYIAARKLAILLREIEQIGDPEPGKVYGLIDESTGEPLDLDSVLDFWVLLEILLAVTCVLLWIALFLDKVVS